MTKNSYKKNAIRERMTLTGESYLEAARQLGSFTLSPWQPLNKALGGGFRPGGMYLVYTDDGDCTPFLFEALVKEGRMAVIQDMDYIRCDFDRKTRRKALRYFMMKDKESLDYLHQVIDSYGEMGVTEFSITETSDNLKLTDTHKFNWLKQTLPSELVQEIPTDVHEFVGSQRTTFDTGSYAVSSLFVQTDNDLEASFTLKPSQQFHADKFKDRSLYYDAGSGLLPEDAIRKIRQRHAPSQRHQLDSPFTSLVITADFDEPTILKWEKLAQELNIPLFVRIPVERKVGTVHGMPTQLLERARAIINCIDMVGDSMIHDHEWRVELVKNRDGAIGVIPQGRSEAGNGSSW